jgi:hypothetical protein
LISDRNNFEIRSIIFQAIALSALIVFVRKCDRFAIQQRQTGKYSIGIVTMKKPERMAAMPEQSFQRNING